jgi:hypothetical protein
MGRRIRHVKVSGSLLLRFLREGLPAAKVAVNPLPEDARLVRAGVDFAGDLVLTVESATFDPWEGGPVPDHPEVWFCDTDVSADEVRRIIERKGQ